MCASEPHHRGRVVLELQSAGLGHGLRRIRDASVGASLKMVMRLRLLPEHPFQKLLRGFSDRAALAVRMVHHGNRNVLGDIAAPAFGSVEGNNPQRARILAAQDVFFDGRLICFRFVSFDTSHSTDTPIADKGGRGRIVRFVPIADIPPFIRSARRHVRSRC
jgi:hypothetical protein